MKKIIATVLSLTMIISSMSICNANNIRGINAGQVEDGTKIKGNNIINRIYIDNEEHLNLFRNIVMGNQYYEGRTLSNCAVILKRDIVLTRPWIPIGDENHRFEGLFVGNGYTIRNMRLDNTAKNMRSIWEINDGHINAATMNFFINVGQYGQIKDVSLGGKILCANEIHEMGHFSFNIHRFAHDYQGNYVTGIYVDETEKYGQRKTEDTPKNLEKKDENKLVSPISNTTKGEKKESSKVINKNESNLMLGLMATLNVVNIVLILLIGNMLLRH